MENDPKQAAEEARKKREAELDRFWNIDALIPSRRPAPPSRNTDTVEIEIPAAVEPGSTPGEPRRPGSEPTTVVHPAETRLNLPKGERFIPPHKPNEGVNSVPPLDDYEPEGYLLRRVRVYSWKSAYRYYEEFAQTAERWHTLPARPAPQVPFFSYVPQYSQMRREQIAFYLWWRDCLRRSKPIPADYSYVLLYVYELINLSEMLPPKEVQDGLLSVWIHYRSTYPQLANSLSDWICDHALIHRLGPPSCDPAVLSDLISHCAVKEFYVPGSGEVGFVRCLLAFNSAYDYHKSKYCTAENLPLFEKTVFAVLRAVTSGEKTQKFFHLSAPENCKVTRDAYSGALCSYRIKRKVEVEYTAFFRSHDIRVLVSDTVKYTENHLRAHLGVRSRLGIYALPTPIREVIDAWFAANLPPKKREAPPVEKPEYEKLYDLPQKPFSLRDAAEIERLSWDTTKRLVEAFEQPEIPEEKPVTPAATFQPTIPEKTPEDPSGNNAFFPYLAFLRAVREGNTAGQRTAADAVGKLPDAVAEEVNQLAVDRFGDILLEETDGFYTVVEDYQADLDRLIASLEGKEN